MNCTQCGNKTVAFRRVVLVELDLDPYAFCNRDCLRAWLGPDRPLSRRLEAVLNGGAAPQHMVVGRPLTDLNTGETFRWCPKCHDWRAPIHWEELR